MHANLRIQIGIDPSWIEKKPPFAALSGTLILHAERSLHARERIKNELPGRTAAEKARPGRKHRCSPIFD
jgi:hypothetical protein